MNDRLAALGLAIASHIEVKFPATGHVKEHAGHVEKAIAVRAHDRLAIHAVPMVRHAPINIQLNIGKQPRLIPAVEYLHADGKWLIEWNRRGIGQIHNSISAIGAD